MSILSQNQRYTNVIPAGIPNGEPTVSIPIFASDFDKLQFSALVDGDAQFDFTVVKSNQENPPDPSLPVSPSNMYSDCSYSDESTQVNYNATTPYNPNGPTVLTDKNFLIETQGARWFFILITNYSAGTLLKLDAFLFSNET